MSISTNTKLEIDCSYCKKIFDCYYCCDFISIDQIKENTEDENIKIKMRFVDTIQCLFCKNNIDICYPLWCSSDGGVYVPREIVKTEEKPENNFKIWSCDEIMSLVKMYYFDKINISEISKHLKRTDHSISQKIKTISEKYNLPCYPNNNTRKNLKKIKENITKDFIGKKYKNSQKSINWIKGIVEKEKKNIMHNENGGEYIIPNTRYRVDGYCPETNTIYEFYGCYYHGCKKCNINKKKINVYEKTIERENALKKMGYNVISIWEHEYI